jgi:hypothetical protein
MQHRISRFWPLTVWLLLGLGGAGCDRLAPSLHVDADPVPVAALPSEPELQRRLDRALDLVYSSWRLNVHEHAAWQIVHGAVAFGRSFPMNRNGEVVSAIDYLLAGGTMRGWNFEPGDQFGERRGLRAILERGSKTGQGHPDQWLGYLSGCNLPREQVIVVHGTEYTLSDLLAQVEWDVPRNVDQEYSWTLMGLTKYHPTDYQWPASDGRTWSIEQLVAVEAEHDLLASACGGAHRLCGLTLAYNRHKAQGGRIEGGWKSAEDRIRESLETIREFQNSDGSFSSNYLERPGRSADLSENLGATGHMLEFVVLAESDDRIRDAWIQRAALFLCDVIERTQNIPLECGALYHATSGLVIYRERLFGPRDFSVASLQP